MSDETKITMEQAEEIGKDLDDFVKGTDTEKILQFPSNNGVEETDPATREPGETRMMNVTVNPETGEHAVYGVADESVLDNETFEEMVARLEKTDMEALETAPITERELVNYIAENKEGSDNVINEISDNFDLSDDAIRNLLKVVNARIEKKDIDVYKEFPDEIKKMVDSYIMSQKVPLFSNEGRAFRRMVCEQLIDEFITNISLNRTMTDFNKEIESLFSKASTEIAEMAVGYTTEKNEKLRKIAENMEDEDKKKKLLDVLDRFDDAYSLSSLKEFAKRCKIKRYDLERPDKIYKSFLSKYATSSYNIYDINVVRPILGRYINTEETDYTATDIDAFFIAFCKQTLNMHPNVPIEHAYMYNVIFNITLADINKGERKEVSDIFIQNVREVINNLRVRNNNFK